MTEAARAAEPADAAHAAGAGPAGTPGMSRGLVVVFAAACGLSVANLYYAQPILYDISRILHGGETNYVMATLTLYLDIYNIFVNLLSLLMAFTGEKD